MDEVVAEVVEEKVMEPKFEPYILQWIGQNNPGASPLDSLEHAMQEAEDFLKDGYTCRILRVQPPPPPKKQRVVVDWPAVCVEGYGFSMKQMESIERHARILDEEVQP